MVATFISSRNFLTDWIANFPWTTFNLSLQLSSPTINLCFQRVSHVQWELFDSSLSTWRKDLLALKSIISLSLNSENKAIGIKTRGKKVLRDSLQLEGMHATTLQIVPELTVSATPNTSLVILQKQNATISDTFCSCLTGSVIAAEWFHLLFHWQ